MFCLSILLFICKICLILVFFNILFLYLSLLLLMLFRFYFLFILFLFSFLLSSSQVFWLFLIYRIFLFLLTIIFIMLHYCLLAPIFRYFGYCFLMSHMNIISNIMLSFLIMHILLLFFKPNILCISLYELSNVVRNFSKQ